MIQKQNEQFKVVQSPTYNYIFDKTNGNFARWGATKNDDPLYAPMPEILDIEITSKCAGPNGKLCGFCYKSNTPKGHNMTFDTFKSIVDKMPWLTQMALGADAQGTANPDMIPMMQYARDMGIIPNVTVADVSEETAKQLADVAGAVAVSVYRHAGYDTAFNSVANLSKYGVNQINLHFMLAKETLQDAYDVLDAMKTDERLKSVKAIVFLSLKQKGRGVKHTYVDVNDYKKLVAYCLENEIPFGFDSCSAPIFIESVEGHKDFDQFYQMAEPCESTLFSSYINEYGEFFPCSFTEKWVEGGWEHGIDVTQVTDFVEEVWNHEKTVDFRNKLIDNTDHNDCRQCPAFTVCGRNSIVVGG